MIKKISITFTCLLMLTFLCCANSSMSTDTHKKQLLFFGASWCEHCQTMKPHFNDKEVQQLIQNYENVKELKDIYKDTDLPETKPLLSKYGIHTIPTLIILENNEIIKRNTGSLTLQGLKDFLK